VRLKVLFASAAAVGAVSCDVPPQRPRSPPVQQQQESFAPDAARQRWTAANTQAELLAGNLTVARSATTGDELSFAFAHGVTLWARPARLPVDDAQVRALALSVQEKLGAPPDVYPTFFEVTEERVAISAPQGGLCGGLKTRIIAVAEFAENPGNGSGQAETWKLRMTAFHVPPLAGATISTDRLGTGASSHRSGAPINAERLTDCFSFDYVAAP
jgi:hypothetical protein